MRGWPAAAAVCAALALSGCASQPIIPPSASVALLQGDTTLDASYNLAAHAYLRQAATLPPDLKHTIKSTLIAYYFATQAADKAQALGDADTLQAKIADASALYHQLQPLLHLP